MNMTVVESAGYSDTPDILCSIKLLNPNLLLYTTNTYNTEASRHFSFPCMFKRTAIFGHFNTQHFQSMSLMLLKYRHWRKGKL